MYQRRRSSVGRQTELRHLDVQYTKMLGQMLNVLDCWQQLMLHIPRAQRSATEFESTELMGFKYTFEDARKIKMASLQPKEHRSAGELLFDEWGTSGRVRPNIGHLMQLLVQLQLYRAAEFLASEVLLEEPPARPTHGIAARVDITLCLQPVEPQQAAAPPPPASVSPNLNRSNDKTGPSNVQKVNDHISDFIKFSQTRQSPDAQHADDADIIIPLMSMLQQPQPAVEASTHSPLLSDANGSHSSSQLFVPDVSALGLGPERSEDVIVPDLTVLQNGHNNHTASAADIPNLTALHDVARSDPDNSQPPNYPYNYPKMSGLIPPK